MFISTVRDHTNEDDPIKKAIEECIDKGISAEYLKRKGSEARNMLVAEYSYEEDIKVIQDEAMLAYHYGSDLPVGYDITRICRSGCPSCSQDLLAKSGSLIFPILYTPYATCSRHMIFLLTLRAYDVKMVSGRKRQEGRPQNETVGMQKRI